MITQNEAEILEAEEIIRLMGIVSKSIKHGNVTFYWLYQENVEKLSWIEESISTYQRGSTNCAPSPTSDALYTAWFDAPELRVGLQHLKPNGRMVAHTSCHCHFETEESWLVVDGHGSLYTRVYDTSEHADWKEIIIAQGDIVSVPLRMAHQLRTTKGLSTILMMKGNVRHPSDELSDGKNIHLRDHHFVQPPP